MLKIKDNNKFIEILRKYNFEYDSDSDYESGVNYAIYFKDGVTFDVTRCSEDLKKGTIEIYGIDNSSLNILYDLIKADLVEKVGEIE